MTIFWGNIRKEHKMHLECWPAIGVMSQRSYVLYLFYTLDKKANHDYWKKISKINYHMHLQFWPDVASQRSYLLTLLTLTAWSDIIIASLHEMWLWRFNMDEISEFVCAKFVKLCVTPETFHVIYWSWTCSLLLLEILDCPVCRRHFKTSDTWKKILRRMIHNQQPLSMLSR
jgi:hypothetical protein